MNKKLWLIFAIISLFSVSYASAVLTDGILYNTMNETTGTNILDLTGHFNGTISGTYYLAQQGKINNSINFTNAEDDYGNVGITENMTFSWWMKKGGNSDGEFLWSKYTTGYELSLYIASPNNELCFFPTGTTCFTNVTGTYNNGEWTHFVIRKTVSNFELFKNGTAIQNKTFVIGSAQTNFMIGDRNAGGTFPYKGFLDEFGIWNRSLTTAEIQDLWNNGAGLTYPFFTAPDNFSVSAIDNFDSSAINNFSVEINGTNYTTTSGTINTNIVNSPTKLFNFTVFNAQNNAGAYFNRTFFEQNLTNDKTATLSQTEIIVNVYSKITNQSVSGAIYNVSQTLANTGSIYGFKAGNLNITFFNSSWFNKTQEFTFTALQNTTVNLTGVYDQILNFTARQLINNTNINNFNVTMTTTTGYTETITTNNGTMFFNVIKNLNITTHIIAPNHADQTDTNYDYINSSTRQYNKTFSLLPDKSFQIFVRDLLNNNLLTDITMYMYGSTTETVMFNQSIYRINLTSGTYNFIFNKTGYAELTDTMTIADYEFINRTEYLTSNPTTIVVYVKNNYDQYLSNALVTIKRQYDNTTVDTETTDFTGAVSFDLNPSLTYYIQVEAEGYPVFFETLNIIDSPVIVILTTSGTIINPYYSGINYNITPNNNEPLTNDTDYIFTFTYISGYWNVTNCYITIASLDNYTTTILNTNSTTCTNTGSITTAINTGQNTTLSLYSTIEIQGTTNITYQTTYTTGYFYEGEVSLVHAIKSLFAFNKAGFANKFGQLFLFFILMLVILEGLMFKDQEQNTPYLSEQQSALISVVVFLITLAGAELGLINLGLTGITGEIVRWGIPLLLSIPMALLLLRAYGEQ